MKKKLLYIVEAFGGGVYTILSELSNTLCEEFDLTIAYALRPQTPPDFKKELDKRIKLIEVKHFQRSISLKQDMRAFFELKQIVKEVNPDIIHLHSSKAGFLGRMAINCKKNIVFYTPHGYSFLMKDTKWIKRQIYWLIEKVSAFTNATTISVSKGENEASLKLTKRACYVSSGIKIEGLPEPRGMSEKEETGKEIKIGTLGRICYPKNPSAFNEIAQAFPKMSFIWIGDGELRSQLTSPNIEITGWLARKEALKRVNELDIFLLPSLWEGLPLSLLEVMYLKKICIVSRVNGNRDVIRDKKNGFFGDTVSDYIKIIQELLEGHYPIKQIEEEAYRDILREYNVKVMSQKYADIYRRAYEKGETR